MDSFEVRPLKSKLGPWVLALGNGVAHLTPAAGGEAVVVQRSEVPELLELMPLWGSKALLVVRRQGAPKLEFRLDGPQRAKVEAWLGPSTSKQLRALFKRRYAFGLPIAIVLMLVSLPLAGDPAAGIPPVQFDVVSFLLGLGLALFWLTARLRPAPILLLLDSAWFVLLASSGIMDVVSGRSSTLWLLWAPLPLWLAWLGVTQFRGLAAAGRPETSTGTA